MKKLALSGLTFFLPVLAFAQSSGQTISSVQGLALFIIDFINRIAIPLIFALAIVVFIFGIFRYFIAGAANDDAKKSGRQLMIYGIVGLFVMVSVWGLVRILTGTISLNNRTPAQQGDLPQVDTVRTN